MEIEVKTINQVKIKLRPGRVRKVDKQGIKNETETGKQIELQQTFKWKTVSSRNFSLYTKKHKMSIKKISQNPHNPSENRSYCFTFF